MTVLDDLKLDSEDEQIGVKIVRKALEMPIKKIVENAGLDGAVVLEKVREEQKPRRTTRSATISSVRNTST